MPMIEFDTPDGSKCPGYVAGPESGPGLVVIQEWWGLNDQMKKTADRFAEAGYRALVPDLYRGEVTTDADEASHKMTHLDWSRAWQQDLAGAIGHLRNGGHKVGVTGFCMGGALTIIAAVHLPCDAAVCFYGIPPEQAADPAQIKVPFMGHFASQDDWCTPAAVDELEAKLKAGSVDYVLYRYEGHHAFMNEQRPDVYDPKIAATAWDRTIGFLDTRLKS